jgi:N-acetylmuramoyl-L-alanine amidase
VLTRSTDATLKLRERVDISRAAHGDLFISLHANLFEKSGAVGGLSVYTLSDKATSKAAAELASKENRADILAGIDLSNENDDVTHILLDLAQHETLNRSVQFAHQLVDQVQHSTPLEKNPGQQASLVVLKAPDVPSVLVELGYLTNEADLARMKSDVWVDQFADEFLAALDRHFQIKNARRDEEKAVLR